MRSLAFYELGSVNMWASIIFVRVYSRNTPFNHEESMGWAEPKGDRPDGHVFVIDRAFGDRAQWKMPAGHKGNGDVTPLDTAVRELLGETGIQSLPDAFRYCGKQLGYNKDHWRCLFTADITTVDRDWMNNHHPENEGEEPKFFTVEQFWTMQRERKMLKNHYDWLVERGLLIPPHVT